MISAAVFQSNASATDGDITISSALGRSSLEVMKRYLAFAPEDDRGFAMRASEGDDN